MVFGIWLILVPTWSHGQQIPQPPTSWVTDEANVLSESSQDSLNEELERFQMRTGHQVLVWIGKTTHGTSIDQWCEKAFRSWKVGNAGVDDGLVLFIMAGDRTARVEVGYGLESRVTDALASHILRESLFPELQGAHFDRAVSQSVDRLLTAIDANAQVGEEPSVQLSLPEWVAVIGGLLVLLVLLIRFPILGYFLLGFISSAIGRQTPIFRGRGGRSGGGGAQGKW